MFLILNPSLPSPPFPCECPGIVLTVYAHVYCSLAKSFLKLVSAQGRKSVSWGVVLWHTTRISSPYFLPSSQDFLTHLVCNLLDEGNALFRDREWEQAVKEFSEGLNVSCYAATEDLGIPEALLESLYVNRAAAYHSMVRHINSSLGEFATASIIAFPFLPVFMFCGGVPFRCTSLI